MRLVIVSHTPHYRSEGRIVGWGPTIREIDQLATRFDSVRHIACLYDESPPASAIPYAASNVTLVGVPPAGASGFLGKLDVLRTSPTYIATILRELRDADMVHVRAPANIALIAMLIVSARKRPLARWFKYAGNWRPSRPESPSYALQRWWLSRAVHSGIVTVNGEWPDQPPWIRSFVNPCLDEAELDRGAQVAATKALGNPLQLVYVGQLSQPKGAGRAVEILGRLRARGVDAELELIGGGDEHASLVALGDSLRLTSHLRFRGWLSPSDVREAYERAHIIVFPSQSEGWPKVLSEAMAYGVVPVASAVSCIPQYLDDLRTGIALPPDELEQFSAAIETYARTPERWAEESGHAVTGARRFSYGSYMASIDGLLAELELSSSRLPRR